MKKLFFSFILFISLYQGVFAFDISNSTVLSIFPAPNYFYSWTLSSIKYWSGSIYLTGSSIFDGGVYFWLYKDRGRVHTFDYTWNDFKDLPTDHSTWQWQNPSSDLVSKITNQYFDLYRFSVYNQFTSRSDCLNILFNKINWKSTYINSFLVSSTVRCSSPLFVSPDGNLVLKNTIGTSTTYSNITPSFDSEATKNGYIFTSYTWVLSVPLSNKDFYYENINGQAFFYDISQPWLTTSMNLNYNNFSWDWVNFNYTQWAIILDTNFEWWSISSTTIHKKLPSSDPLYWVISTKWTKDSKDYIRTYIVENWVKQYYNDRYIQHYNPFYEKGVTLSLDWQYTLPIDSNRTWYSLLTWYDFLWNAQTTWMYWWNKLWGKWIPVITTMSGLTSNIQDASNSSTITNNINTFTGFTTNISVINTNTGITEWDKSFWGGITNWLGSAINGVSNSIGNIWDGIVNTITSMKNSIKGSLDDGFNSIKCTLIDCTGTGGTVWSFWSWWVSSGWDRFDWAVWTWGNNGSITGNIGWSMPWVVLDTSYSGSKYCKMFDSVWNFIYYNNWPWFTLSLNTAWLVNNSFIRDYILVWLDKLVNMLLSPINNALNIIKSFSFLDDNTNVCFFGTVQSVHYQSILDWNQKLIGALDIQKGSTTFIDYLVLMAYGLFVIGYLSFIFYLMPPTSIVRSDNQTSWPVERTSRSQSYKDVYWKDF